MRLIPDKNEGWTIIWAQKRFKIEKEWKQK